jgi:hypothetical protein
MSEGILIFRRSAAHRWINGSLIRASASVRIPPEEGEIEINVGPLLHHRSPGQSAEWKCVVNGHPSVCGMRQIWQRSDPLFLSVRISLKSASFRNDDVIWRHLAARKWMNLFIDHWLLREPQPRCSTRNHFRVLVIWIFKSKSNVSAFPSNSGATGALDIRNEASGTCLEWSTYQNLAIKLAPIKFNYK